MRDGVVASRRERLLAAESCLAELRKLRHRQEVVVRAALREEESPPPLLRGDEKLLDENVQLLRKKLRCVRTRDAGLANQLHELDRQMGELRLGGKASSDPAEATLSHDQHEADSRVSSGFYELSDTASSSNSVIGECFCWTTADPDGCRPNNYVGGVCSTCDFCATPTKHGGGGEVLRSKVSEAAPAATDDDNNKRSPVSEESAARATRLDNYIARLLLRRAPPTRASCPKTLGGGSGKRTRRRNILTATPHTDGFEVPRPNPKMDAAPLAACKRVKRPPPPASSPGVRHHGNIRRRHVTKTERGRRRPTRDAFGHRRKTGSDSEYSAECSYDGSASRQRAGGGGPGVTLVKVKASRHLKKKMLRFRSGSLRLMTTV
ncbi:dapper homolog 1 [Festucalex cinctus]